MGVVRKNRCDNLDKDCYEIHLRGKLSDFFFVDLQNVLN